MKASAWKQYQTIVAQGWRGEINDKERLASPVLFAITILLTFNFAMGDIDSALRMELFVAETFFTALMALQISFSRVFEPDRGDRVFDLMRVYPVSHGAWFLAKYTLVCFTGALILIPTLLISSFFHHSAHDSYLSFFIVGVSLLALAGLAAVGVLLSAMTLKAGARQILYPLLYFPLTVPVLLGAVQSSLMFYGGEDRGDSITAWLLLLLCFDVIYITLGLLLYGELIDDI